MHVGWYGRAAYPRDRHDGGAGGTVTRWQRLDAEPFSYTGTDPGRYRAGREQHRAGQDYDRGRGLVAGDRVQRVDEPVCRRVGDSARHRVASGRGGTDHRCQPAELSRGHRERRNAAATAPVPASSNRPVSNGVPAKNATSRSVTSVTSPGRPTDRHAVDAASCATVRPAGPAPAAPTTPPATRRLSTSDSADRSAAVSGSAGRRVLDRWLAPPASPRATTAPSRVATRQRVVVPPASTPTTNVVLIGRTVGARTASCTP